jgi:hypothetical protein
MACYAPRTKTASIQSELRKDAAPRVNIRVSEIRAMIQVTYFIKGKFGGSPLYKLPIGLLVSRRMGRKPCEGVLYQRLIIKVMFSHGKIGGIW